MTHHRKNQIPEKIEKLSVLTMDETIRFYELKQFLADNSFALRGSDELTEFQNLWNKVKENAATRLLVS